MYYKVSGEVWKYFQGERVGTTEFSKVIDANSEAGAILAFCTMSEEKPRNINAVIVDEEYAKNFDQIQAERKRIQIENETRDRIKRERNEYNAQQRYKRQQEKKNQEKKERFQNLYLPCFVADDLIETLANIYLVKMKAETNGKLKIDFNYDISWGFDSCKHAHFLISDGKKDTVELSELAGYSKKASKFFSNWLADNYEMIPFYKLDWRNNLSSMDETIWYLKQTKERNNFFHTKTKYIINISIKDFLSKILKTINLKVKEENLRVSLKWRLATHSKSIDPYHYGQIVRIETPLFNVSEPIVLDGNWEKEKLWYTSISNLYVQLYIIFEQR